MGRSSVKRVLVFVLACPLPPYDQMTGWSKQTWARDKVDGVRVVFYHGRPTQLETEDMVSFPIEEGYHTISAKNLLAFEWALRQPDWDFMARVNASCYVEQNRLSRAVQDLPDTGVARGVFAEPTPHCGTTRRWLWGGGQFIFSRDVVQAIVDHGDKLNHGLIEDVALSELIQDLGFTVDDQGQCCSVNKTDKGWTIISYGGQPSFETEELGNIPHHFFFRVKQDLNRAMDFEVMRILKANLNDSEFCVSNEA